MVSTPAPPPVSGKMETTDPWRRTPRIFVPANPAVGSPSSERIHLTPNFTMGESFHYHIESRTTTTGVTTSPVVNPEASTQLKQVANLQLRLDVLGVQPAANGAPAAYRLRATYEHASSTTDTDSYDPATASLDDQYNHLQGRSVEFTIEPGGKISHVTGLDDIMTNPTAASSMRNWLDGFSPSASFPPEGIAIGQKWTSEHPLDNTPLANLLWRTEATYLRDEPCEVPGVPASSAQKCRA